MRQIENVFNIKVLILGILAILLFSCNHSKVIDADESIKLVEYKIDINGRTAVFSLPQKYFKDEIPKIEYHETYNKKVFYKSQTNPKNYFTVIEKIEDNIPDEGIDLYMEYAKELRNDIWKNAITCTEKKFLNGHPLYYLMNFYRYPFSYDRYDDIADGDTICSIFEYIVYYGNTRYHFVLHSEDHIKEFSYEEKRQVLESVRF